MNRTETTALLPAKRISNSLRGVLAAFLLAATGGSANAQVVVYENSADYSGSDYESTEEYGDQIILAGTERMVTQFEFEYYADFVAQGDEICRVRFYANTGPFWEGNSEYPTPANPPLWEETFTPRTNYQTIILTVPNVVVPDTFTWTVQFFGLTQNTTPRNDIAGLLFYGVPTVGDNYNDFWELTPEGWGPLARTDIPKNNFGARVLAAPVPPSPRMTITQVDRNIRISWPSSATGFKLQTKANLTAPWSAVATTPTLNGSNYEVVLPIGSQNQFFRLVF